MLVAHDEVHANDSEDEDDPLMPKDGGDHHSSGTDGDMSNTKFLIITAGILISGFLIALAVDELEVGRFFPSRNTCLLLTGDPVLGFVGSTGSTIVSFILPGFFFFRAFRAEAGVTKWFALALGIYGLATMTFWWVDLG